MEAYFRYWGKAGSGVDEADDDYHLLPYHCLDVAAVGFHVLDDNNSLLKDIADFLDIPAQQLRTLLLFLLAVHDLGKFSSSFQGLYTHASDNLVVPSFGRSLSLYDASTFRHDRLGVYFWRKLQEQVAASFGVCDDQKSNFYDAFYVLLNCVFGHHGKPVEHYIRLPRKSYLTVEDVAAASAWLAELFTLFKPVFPLHKIDNVDWCNKLKQVSWHIAGIAVLADWLGSDRRYFPYRSHNNLLSTRDYWPQALAMAKRALAQSGLQRERQVQPYVSIAHHYGYEATPLQQWVQTVPLDNAPQLFILEDITGSGKTEAAMALTHRLMEQGVADGFYFGLPTMATSNAMFDRVAKHYGDMLLQDGDKADLVLAHGARDMHDPFRHSVLAPDHAYSNDDPSVTSQCNDWLADSNKKALLAAVGVGTIDQALAAVLPRKHQSLRLLGLHRKVLIFDEVHAADEYMLVLLESLLALHVSHGGSAILLTATLALKQRQRLVNIWQRACGLEETYLESSEFPLATYVSPAASVNVMERAIAPRQNSRRVVQVEFLHSVESCIATVMAAVGNGQCVVWVRNSVDDAFAAFESIRAQLDDPESCLLFHSRFVLADRKRIETQVLEWLGKGSAASDRRGKVVICTQVFQESLDADVDVMLSDICPIDDLIQRAGRLHRHVRNEQGAYDPDALEARAEPVLYVHAPVWNDEPDRDWLKRDFAATQAVYRSPGRLWLGMRVLRRLGGIALPEQARDLIEAVYSDEAENEKPQAFVDAENKALGEEKNAKGVASFQKLRLEEGYSPNSAVAWHEDVGEVSTRYSIIETVQLVLLRRNSDGHLVLWSNEGRFSVALSTLKLPKEKLNEIAGIPESLECEVEQLRARYRAMSYMQCWLPDEDLRYGYDVVKGFYQKA